MWKNWKKYNTNWMQRVFTFKGKVLPIQQHIKFYFEVKHSQLPVWVVLFQVSGIIYANFEQLQQSTNNQNKQNGVLVQYPLCNFANQSGIQIFPRDQKLPRGFWTVSENMLFYRRELRVHSVIFPFLINKNPHVFVDMFLTSFHLSR